MVDDGVDASVARRAAQRERRLFVSFGIALLVGAVIAAAITVVLGPDEETDPRSLPETLILAGILVAAFAVMFGLAVVFLWWRRRRGSTTFARSPLYELPVRRRGPLVRALRRGDPIPADQQDFALRVARDTAGRRGLVWIFAAAAVVQGANAVLQADRLWQPWLYSAAAIGFLATAVYWWWLVGRMRLAVIRLTGDR